MSRLDSHAHYQLRLVKRFNGANIVTHRKMAAVKSTQAKDKTLDFTAGSERGALQKARNYCSRGSNRKGELPGEFIGVVVAKHTSDPNKSVAVSYPGFEVSSRHRRSRGTTVWLYYVDAHGKAYHIDPSNRELLGPVL